MLRAMEARRSSTPTPNRRAHRLEDFSSVPLPDAPSNQNIYLIIGGLGFLYFGVLCIFNYWDYKKPHWHYNNQPSKQGNIIPKEIQGTSIPKIDDVSISNFPKIENVPVNIPISEIPSFFFLEVMNLFCFLLEIFFLFYFLLFMYEFIKKKYLQVYSSK